MKSIEQEIEDEEEHGKLNDNRPKRTNTGGK